MSLATLPVYPDGTRTYELAGGIYPSVTSILSRVWPRADLHAWQTRQALRWAYENEEEFRAGMAGGLYEGAVAAQRGAERTSRGAATRGTRVHKVAEATALGCPRPKVPPEEEGYVAALDAFLAAEVTGFVAAEATVLNRADRYAGTLDAICELRDGHRALIDWKTNARLYAEHAVQLAAYWACPEMATPRGLVERPPMDTAIVVRLGADGAYEARRIEWVMALAAWMAVLQLWDECVAPSVWLDGADGE